MNPTSQRSTFRQRSCAADAIAFAACVLISDGDAKEFQRAISLGDDEIRIQEVFTTHLPDTIEANGIRASLHPRFNDLRERDYLRVFAGVRYGVTDRLEISAGADFYFSHGLGDLSLFEEGGVSRMQFGAKLNVGRLLLNAWHSSIGFDALVPTGDPPPGFNDGLKHLMPYVTFSRRLDSHPDFRVFWGGGFDFVDPTMYPGVLGTNQLDDDTVRFSAGIVWDRDTLHYLFETHWDTTRVIGNTNEDVFTLRPGIIWEVPSLRNRSKPSGWLFGVAADVSFGPDGTNVGATSKLRYNFDLRHLFRGKNSGK